ncbi:metallophosphoesterase [Pinibacter aurantiacus]|uniref:Metallophosphoesterase n=1 Tax=Pinibacter aurantiacus TaxID=2851599 RepID=A0A9E2SEA8_9BACT|nr:metallophosphoesterase [Pinibacter aurantiacus]MBV4358450.1 metallophosphoesterase [Pinibacter aurantiacus]
MKILKICVPLIIALSACKASHSDESFFFVQMSDPQFGFYTDNKSFDIETAHFEKAIQKANRLHPAFVIVTGDLVHKTLDAAQIDEYKRIAARLDSDIPLYNVPGNHDVGNEPTPKDVDGYNAAFGPDYYTFHCGNMLGIVLNSNYLHSPEKAMDKAKAQEEWLIRTLDSASNKSYKNKVVFMHHPLFIERAEEGDGYFNIPTVTRKKYLDLLKANGVKYIFAGHLHRNFFGKSDSLEITTTGPVGKPLGQDSSGLRIVQVNGGVITSKYYVLDSIPAKMQ